MAFTNPYLQRVYDDLAKRNPEQKEFLQGIKTVLLLSVPRSSIALI